MFRTIAALWLLLAGTVAAGSAVAQFPELPSSRVQYELTADAVEYESGRRIYVARGNVRIVSGNTELTADWMAFSDAQHRGVATGAVVYRAGDDVLRAQFIEFNIDTERGVLFGGRFESGENQFKMQGKEIVKRAGASYSFEDGVFTTCRCPPGERDPWQIKAGSADLEIGGYGTARNTTFEILGVPVVWLPWMIYPLKTERESGLLFPELGYGNRNGFDIGLPIFWAARENVNVTLTPRWLSKRGAKGDLEVEYVFGERSKGEVGGSFLYDQEIDPNSRKDPFDRERWAARAEQDIFLPGAIRFKADVKAISDNEYLSDFHDLPAREADRFLESNAFAGRSFGESGRFGARAGAVFADDLQNPDDEDRDEFLLQRLPTANVSALPAALVESVPVLSRIVPAFDFEYSYFVPLRRAVDEFDHEIAATPAYRVGDLFIDTGIDAIPSTAEYGYNAVTKMDPHRDDVATAPSGLELDGKFEEGEPLADDGHRMDLFPRLGVPFRIGNWVEAYPEVGWHQTFYDTHLQGSDERHLLTARLDLRTRLIRRFGTDMTHLLEPRIGYAFVSDLGQNQAENPLFVPETAVPQERVRQLDLDNVTLDTADRVAGSNVVSFGVANRIYDTSDAAAPDLIADWYISNQISIEDGRFGNIYLGGRAYPFEGVRVWANVGFDPEAATLEEIIFQAAYHSAAGHSARLDYRYLRDVPRFFEDFQNSSRRFDKFSKNFTHINQIRLAFRFAVTPHWFVFHRAAYSFEDSLFLANRGGFEYVSKCGCWAGGIEIGQNRAHGVYVNLIYRLLGLGKQFESPAVSGAGLLDAF